MGHEYNDDWLDASVEANNQHNVIMDKSRPRMHGHLKSVHMTNGCNLLLSKRVTNTLVRPIYRAIYPSCRLNLHQIISNFVP